MKLKYVYGPVYSWRLGISIGVDLVTHRKVCSFDCIYCQLGKTDVKTLERGVFVPTDEVLMEVDYALSRVDRVDYLTFSGKGEPLLAKNIREVVKILKKEYDVPLALLTNSSLISEASSEILEIDNIVAKLDACTQDVFEVVNNPVGGLLVRDIIHDLRNFRQEYNGKLSVQVMLVNHNFKQAEKLAEVIRGIEPDEVHLNTPLRPCKTNPLSKQAMREVKEIFRDLNVKMVYDHLKKEKITPLDKLETRKRRPE